MTAPLSTIRLQFHKDFTFDDAAALAAYFAALGVSHVYASPIFRARAGSTHGYDVADPTMVNPELGGENALRRLVGTLRAHGLGLILDIVPNHMGVGPDNLWWQNMLAQGPESPYAAFFDVDWNPPDPSLAGKILLPVLGDQYGAVLDRGELRLVHAPEQNAFFVEYFDTRFPLREVDNATFGLRGAEASLAAHDPADTEGRARLHELLERQHYRLAWWRTASDDINWRRFFDVNELAGLRMEDPDVFEAAHALIFRLYGEGLIDGVRIDHVDGLADPAGYCRKLRQRLAELEPQRPPDAPGGSAYLVVEKILAEGESLPTDWETDGTSGYDFMDEISAVLHDGAGAPALTALWAEIAGGESDFAHEEHEARWQVVRESFTAELEALVLLLHGIARQNLETRDTSLPSLRRALAELLAHFPVYRTYARPEGRGPIDDAVMQAAIDGARPRVRPGEAPVLDLLGRWLGGEPPASFEGEARAMRETAIRKFQQLTSPVAAKSVEDTAFYRYGRLISRNEVGSDPGTLAISPDIFHERAAHRAENFPHALLATATHDHKRGEDVRARLAVLSEIPGDWAATLREWRETNAALLGTANGRPAPDAIDQAMLYQTLVGAWPVDLSPDDRDGLTLFAGRIKRWQLRAIREAKRHSRWVTPNEAYEKACADFVDALLLGDPAADFRQELAGFVERIAAAGAVNGLGQALIRNTAPGVPDLYQGTDFWDFSLVDPDNRAPVDYGARATALNGTDDAAALLRRWRDGHIKQHVVTRALALRRDKPELFLDGSYEPLTVQGALADRVIAFARRKNDDIAVSIATRLASKFVGNDLPLLPANLWKDTAIVLPNSTGPFVDRLTGRTIIVADGRIEVAAALRTLPVALFTTE